MSTTFVTAIYANLPDGSRGRWERYTLSLKSITNCGASFIVFTSPEEYNDVSRFVLANVINPERVQVWARDLARNRWHNTFINLSKWYSSGKRSMDLVHSKIGWLNEVAAKNPFNTTHFFWIDAGLSFEGLFPRRFLRRFDHTSFEKYTDFSVFNAEWLAKLEGRAIEKVYVVGMTSKVMLWAEPLDSRFYRKNYKSFHVIGGLFGGSNRERLIWFENEYNAILDDALKNYPLDKKLPVEELIFNVIVSNDLDLFDLDLFDTWYHEDHEACFNTYKRGKPFYHLFYE